MIRFADSEVPRAAIAQLAARLHQARRPGLARRLRNAIDDRVDELLLTSDDVTTILKELSQEQDPALDEFGDALEAHRRDRSLGTEAAELPTIRTPAKGAV